MRLKDAKIGFLGDCFRVLQTLFLGADIPGVALTLNPRLRALGLRPRHSAFQVGYLRRRGSRRPASADNHMLMIKSHTDFTDYTDNISATAAQSRLIITSLPQSMTAARPERSNARAKRVARSRGWSEAKPSVSWLPP